MNHRIKPPSNILSTYTRKHGHLRTLFVLIACLSMLTLNIRPDIVYADNQSTNTDEYPIPPEIESGNCILMDADSGIVLYEKNSGEKCYPASVTKLMTALIVAENANLSDTLTVSANAVSSVKYGDANAGLKTGEEFSVEQALNMMLIKSANDIAYALGEHVGGSVANFANMMNKRAAELGCLNTHFTNASGLTDVNHYTTAYDMALICRAVLDYPVIMNAISYKKSYSVPPTNKTSDTRYYRLSHSMVTGKYLYEYCIGGKTGYTDAAGHTSLYFSGAAASGDIPSDNRKPADGSAASDSQIQSGGSAASDSALPYLASDTSASPLSNAVTVTGHFIYINLWLFISIVCVFILIVLLLIINAKKNRHGLRF